MNNSFESALWWCTFLCFVQIVYCVMPDSNSPPVSVTSTPIISQTSRNKTTATSNTLDLSSFMLDCSAFANTSDPSMIMMGWEARLQACFDANPYDVRFPPLPIGMPTLEIAFDYNVMYLISLEHDIISIFGQMVLSWTDYYRIWNKSQIPLMSIQVPVSTIWYPQFLFQSAVTKRSYKLLEPDDTAVITGYYYTAIARRNVLEGHCDMNYYNFPFDTQTCTLVFILNRIFFYNRNINFVRENYTYIFDNFTSEEWRYVSIKSLAINQSYYVYNINEDGSASSKLLQTIPDQVSGFVVNITLARLSQFYVINIVAPIIVLSVMGQTSFALPERAEGKIVVPLTVLLGFMFVQDIVARELPHSQYVPRIAIYVCSCVMLNAANCLASALLMFLAYTNCRMPRRLNRFIRCLSFPIFPSQWLICCRLRCRCSCCSRNVGSESDKTVPNSSEASINDIDFSLQPITKHAHNKHKSVDDAEEEHCAHPWQPMANYLNRLFAIIHLSTFVLLFVGIVLPIAYSDADS